MSFFQIQLIFLQPVLILIKEKRIQETTKISGFKIVTLIPGGRAAMNHPVLIGNSNRRKH